MFKKFKKKPVVVDAVQFTDKNKNQVLDTLKEVQGNVYHSWDKDKKPIIKIPTLEGEMDASLNDWIIKGVKGEIYLCKPDIFDLTYEPESTQDESDYMCNCGELISKEEFEMLGMCDDCACLT